MQTTPRALAGRVVALDATVPGLDPDDPRTCEALGLSQALGRAAASLAMNDATDADVRPTALRARHLVTLAARCKSAEARAGLARDIFAIVGPERALRDLAILAVGESAVASDPLAGIALASLSRALVDRDDLPRHIARRCPAAWDTLRALVQPSLRRIARAPRPGGRCRRPSRPHPRLTPSPRHPVRRLVSLRGHAFGVARGVETALRLGRRRPQFPDVSVAGRRPRPGAGRGSNPRGRRARRRLFRIPHLQTRIFRRRAFLRLRPRARGTRPKRRRGPAGGGGRASGFGQKRKLCVVRLRIRLGAIPERRRVRRTGGTPQRLDRL